MSAEDRKNKELNMEQMDQVNGGNIIDDFEGKIVNLFEEKELVEEKMFEMLEDYVVEPVKKELDKIFEHKDL